MEALREAQNLDRQKEPRTNQGGRKVQAVRRMKGAIQLGPTSKRGHQAILEGEERQIDQLSPDRPMGSTETQEESGAHSCLIREIRLSQQEGGIGRNRDTS